MGQKLIVRKLTPHDFDQVITLFHRYYDEAVESIAAMAEERDDNSIIDTVRYYSSHYDHCWYVAMEGQRPVGFIAGFASEAPWNKNIIYANVAFVYLIDTHRNIDNFRELINKFKEWAELIGAQKITAGDIGINPEKMQKIYEHFDFTPVLFMERTLK
jgi:GNAT superfamily N-acetyltransferase